MHGALPRGRRLFRIRGPNDVHRCRNLRRDMHPRQRLSVQDALRRRRVVRADGPGSGRPTCSGVPTPCAMLTETECSTVAGCRDSGTCSGTPLGCSFLDLGSCVIQKGCTWSANSCSGIQEPCSNSTFDSDCRGQLGCRWTSACSGTPTSSDCSTKRPASCESTPGCALETQ